MASQTRATIAERKTRLDGSVVEYVCERLLVEPDSRAVVRYVTDRERAIEGTDLVLPKGTVTIGHFWTDRPYNVYHWREGDRTLAFYVSVAADTAISEHAVAYTDLAIDVLLRPSGAIEILDEDEVPPDLAPAYRLVIAKALEALVTNARRLAEEIERESRPWIRLAAPP